MTLTWRDRLILLSPIAAIGALLVMPAEDGPTLCPFAMCTGIACPGCGMTRAASRLVRGDLGGALSLHPLVPAFALAAAGGWAWYALRRSGRVQPVKTKVINVGLILIGIALVGVWVARLMTGTLPDV